jgi:hypothetical protein
LKESNLVNNLLFKHYTYRNSINPSILNLVTKKLHKQLEKNINNFITKPNRAYAYMFDNMITCSLISDRGLRQITGYDIKDCIYDPYGTFYIVHPDELIIKRNLLTGEIIKINSTNNDFICSLKIHKYLSRCFKYNLLINNNYRPIDNNIFSNNLKDEFKSLDINYTKSNLGRIIANIVSNMKFHDKDININWFMTYTIIYAYICNIDNLAIILISLISYSNYKLSGLNPNTNFLKSIYGSEDLEIYYNISIQLLTFFTHMITTTNGSNINSTEHKIIQFEHEKTQYIKQKLKIKNDLKYKQNYWNLDISLDLYERLNLLDNRDKLNSTINLYDYNKEKNKKTIISKNDIDLILHKFMSLGIIADKTSIIRFIKKYNEIKNEIDKLKNIDEIKTNTNDLLWFKYNIPINISTDNWINIKKAFIFGFGTFNTVVLDPETNNIFDININKKKFKQLPESISKLSSFMVYLIRERDELSIIINTDIETLAECTIYNYSPLNMINFDIINTGEYKTINNFEIYLFNKYTELFRQKNKFIGNLIIKHHLGARNKFNQLFIESNNLIEHIIKLWTIDFKTNIFGSNLMKNTYNYDKYLQNGGKNRQNGGKNRQKDLKKYIIKINELPYILSKFNIKIKTFFNKLIQLYQNDYYIEINDNDIIIKL